MRLSVSRAVAVESTRGWRIAKEKARHKIDVVVALAQAALAAVRSQSDSTWDPLYRSPAWVGLGSVNNESRAEVADEYRRTRLIHHIYGIH